MKSFLIVILMLVVSIQLQAQNKLRQNRTITGTESFWYKDTMAIENAKANSNETFGELERAVDPEVYIVGPGDSFLVSILSYQPIELKLPVTPEGNVIIPSVGKIDVNEISLKEAKNRINHKVEELYEGSEVFTALTKIKKFKVIVSGSIAKSQIVTATSMDRVSEVFDRIGGLNFDASIRNIKILRKSKDTILNVDLDEFFNLNRNEANPYLMGGDHIIINSVKEDRVMLISGEVYSGDINIEYSENDSLTNIIRLAKGFTPFAKLDSVELLRYNQNSNSYKRYYLNLSDWTSLMDKPYKDYSNDINLVPGDRIYIRKKVESLKENYISITGEVKFPGRYTITQKEIRLNDIVNLAGGITEDASLENAVLIRQKDIDLRDEELNRISNKPLSEMSESEKRYYEVRIREKKGALVIDFNDALKNPSSNFNVLLQTKDSVHIPDRKDYINVQGKVVKPGLIRYLDGMSLNEYIDLAGGFTQKADESETFIKRSTGETFLASSSNYKLKPGDVILVPEKPDVDFWNEFFKWFTFVTQVITVLSVIITLSNTQ